MIYYKYGVEFYMEGRFFDKGLLSSNCNKMPLWRKPASLFRNFDRFLVLSLRRVILGAFICHIAAAQAVFSFSCNCFLYVVWYMEDDRQ